VIKVQYISDSSGKTTGVFIPIDEWVVLKKQYGVEGEELGDVPDWQREEVDKRLTSYLSNPSRVSDFDQSIREIEREINL